MLPAAFEQWLQSLARPPLVMGVLNVTPDSFSDGGLFVDPGRARAHSKAMAAAGADLIDIGGESTRPGSQRVDAAEQIRRVVPVIRACRDLPVTLSIDTMLADVAAAGLDAGATIVNDVSAGRHDDPAMFALIARARCPVVLMHVLGQIETMQLAPHYDDVVGEVRSFLSERSRLLESLGVARHHIMVDPGFGFGKNFAHNMTLLAELHDLVDDGRPVLAGVSRKSFVGRLTGKESPADRVFGTAAAVAWAVTQGAAIVRVHDVAAMKDVVSVAAGIRAAAVVRPPE